MREHWGMTPTDIKVLGICGFARSGKDSFADFLCKLFPCEFKKTSLAYELKRDLNPFLLSKLGISAFTEKPKEKEIIRPLLITWGTDVIRNKFSKSYWIDKIKKKIVENSKSNFITIIPDVRFVNEIEWIKMNGESIYIERDDCFPVGLIENETAKLKGMADHVFKWPKMKNFERSGLSMVENFSHKNLSWLDHKAI